jgi:hypothetical protein
MPKPEPDITGLKRFLERVVPMNGDSSSLAEFFDVLVEYKLVVVHREAPNVSNRWDLLI